MKRYRVEFNCGGEVNKHELMVQYFYLNEEEKHLNINEILNMVIEFLTQCESQCAFTFCNE